ncbi:hypothetical protein SDC9_76331 [bioreactor metagenome]|uniref:Uncharacterized protein n=1 Tax=bioreactor metagenome TaxID=1076179 RepID=A0A644YMY6_9ZZZZ
MLQKSAEPLALHHVIVLLVFQKHPDQGGLGQGLVDQHAHAAILRALKNIVLEAGTVVGVDVQDAALDSGRTPHGRINRQIPALGMTADDEGAGEPARDVFQIPQRVLLGGHGAHKGHVEVFLPPGEGGVGAPESDVGRFAVQEKGNGGKLFLKLEVQLVHIVIRPYIPEAGTCGKGDEQPPVALMVPDAVEHGAEALGPQQVPDPDRLGAAREARDEGGKIDIGKLRQHQTVHRIKGLFLEPCHLVFHIINDVPHVPASLLPLMPTAKFRFPK